MKCQQNLIFFLFCLFFLLFLAIKKISFLILRFHKKILLHVSVITRVIRWRKRHAKHCPFVKSEKRNITLSLLRRGLQQTFAMKMVINMKDSRSILLFDKV